MLLRCPAVFPDHATKELAALDPDGDIDCTAGL
jgi:hypothetical protein